MKQEMVEMQQLQDLQQDFKAGLPYFFMSLTDYVSNK